jgi:hypothetical protein
MSRFARFALLASLAAALAGSGCDADPTYGVVVLPDVSAASKVAVARGGQVTFRVKDPNGMIAGVSVTSSAPKVLHVDSVQQELGSDTAFVEVTARTTGDAELQFSVGGVELTRVAMDVEPATRLEFVASGDGVEPPMTFSSEITIDARSALWLAVQPETDAQAPLLGYGLVSVDAPGEIGVDEDHDVLLVKASADKPEATMSFALDEEAGPMMAVHGFTENPKSPRVTALTWTGVDEAAGQVQAGEHVCLGVAPMLEQTRIVAAQATWSRDGKAFSGGAAAYLCYTYSPKEKEVVLAASYDGKSVTRAVHGTRFTPLAGYTPPPAY